MGGAGARFPRDATRFPIEDDVVAGCVDPTAPADLVFDGAWRSGLASMPLAERRGRFCQVIGEVAEAVAEVCLVEVGYHLVAEVGGAGRHGVDAIVLDPAGERLVAVEVKGTLRPGRWPRPSRGRVRQMSREWLDQLDNPAMAEYELGSADVYGALVCVNLADRCFRVGFTRDFELFAPVTDADRLVDLSWLDDVPLP